MNNAMKSKLNLLVVACALQVSVTHAQSESKPNLSLTLAPVDAASAAGTGAGSDAKAAEAELAKKLQNPIANLISMPIQNNWDFGIGPGERHALHGQYPAGDSVFHQPGLESHHPDNPAGNLRRVTGAGRQRQVRFGRRYAELFPVAQGTGRWLDSRGRPGGAVAHGDG
jgi:hypothetical protein